MINESYYIKVLVQNESNFPYSQELTIKIRRQTFFFDKKRQTFLGDQGYSIKKIMSFELFENDILNGIICQNSKDKAKLQLLCK